MRLGAREAESVTAANRPAMDPEYRRKVEAFVRSGAALIECDIPTRYPEAVPWNGARPLEPGFIPPDRKAKVTAISWYPNDGDLRGKVDYDVLRENFARWGRDRTVESYRVAYEDWLASLPHIRFYRKHTLPVLDGLGLTAREIAWIPLIKVPMRPKSRPPDKAIELDLDYTWTQMRLLFPRVVWIQGVTTTKKWIETQVREQITEQVAVQDITDQKSTADRQAIIGALVQKLQGFLGTTVEI